MLIAVIAGLFEIEVRLRVFHDYNIIRGKDITQFPPFSKRLQFWENQSKTQFKLRKKTRQKMI